MKTHLITTITIAIALSSCGSTAMKNAVTKINTPAVQAQILGDAERVLLAGGGALLISGGSGGAAVAAMTAQEVKNLPGLQAALDSGTPATITTTAPATVVQTASGK